MNQYKKPKPNPKAPHKDWAFPFKFLPPFMQIFLGEFLSMEDVISTQRVDKGFRESFQWKTLFKHITIDGNRVAKAYGISNKEQEVPPNYIPDILARLLSLACGELQSISVQNNEPRFRESFLALEAENFKLLAEQPNLLRVNLLNLPHVDGRIIQYLPTTLQDLHVEGCDFVTSDVHAIEAMMKSQQDFTTDLILCSTCREYNSTNHQFECASCDAIACQECVDEGTADICFCEICDNCYCDSCAFELHHCDKCDKISCDECDDIGGYCEKCENYFCMDCVPTCFCEKCEQGFCVNCSPTGFCRKCMKSYCIDCDPMMMPCFKCHEMNCMECSPGGYCEQCNKYLCKSCDKQAWSTGFCRKCKSFGRQAIRSHNDVPRPAPRKTCGKTAARSPGCQEGMEKCDVCSKPCSLACSECHSVFYCDISCQKKGWASHKKVCNLRKKSKKKGG